MRIRSGPPAELLRQPFGCGAQADFAGGGDVFGGGSGGH